MPIGEMISEHLLDPKFAGLDGEQDRPSEAESGRLSLTVVGASNAVAIQDAQWQTTDIANASRFVDAHGQKLRYAHNGGDWHHWNQGRWQRDMTGATSALAQATITAWWKEVGYAGSSEECKILAKHVLASGRRQRIEAMLNLAAADPRVALPADAFDRDPFLFTVANGTLDLRTGTLRKHRAGDLISKRSPVLYDSSAKYPRFLEFVKVIFDGDQALIDFVQRALGYSLTGSVGEQCLFFCWGTGSNGKSTLISIMHAIMGEYAKVAMPTLLMQQKHEPHPTEIADLLGARFVSSVETERDRRIAEVKIKWLTGGDRLKARFMRKDFFEFDPTHKFWLLGNHKPIVQGTDPAIWRRLYLVPFTVNLKELLGDRLVLDFAATVTSEYPGILRWLVEGAVAWHNGGLQPPDAVLNATNTYREEMDAVALWVEEFCVRDPRARTPFKVLFDAYETEFKSDALSKRAFAQELDRLGISNEKVGGVTFRTGIRLRLQHQDDQDHDPDDI